MKVLEENIGATFSWPWISQWFLKYDTKNTRIKKKKEREMDKSEFIKIKSCCASKDTSKKLKDNLQNGKKYLQIMYLIRNLHLISVGKNVEK